MIGSPLQRTTAVFLLVSQLMLVAAAGPVLVNCRSAGGHEAIELNHASPCGDDGLALAANGAGDLPAIDQSATDQLSNGDCIDTPLSQPPVIRQHERSLSDPIPVLLAYRITPPPLDPIHISGAPSHIFLPNSPESLARSVILLI